jgi:hypothetical protein
MRFNLTVSDKRGDFAPARPSAKVPIQPHDLLPLPSTAKITVLGRENTQATASYLS